MEQAVAIDMTPHQAHVIAAICATMSEDVEHCKASVKTCFKMANRLEFADGRFDERVEPIR